MGDSRTLKQAKEKSSSERGGKGSGISRKGGTGVPEQSEIMRDILFPTPEDIRDVSTSDPSVEREQRREQSNQQLNINLEDQFGSNLDSVDQTISDLFDVQLGQASEAELLRFIAEALRAMTLQNKVMLDQGSAASVFLNDIATAVESATDITLSGTNDIDDQDEPQRLLSSGRRATTRQLIIRCDPENEFPVYFGDDDVNPGDGFMLRPGEWIKLNVNYRDSLLYMASEEKGQTVHVLGVI